MPSIRLADRTDIPAMAALLGELFAQEHEFSPDRTVQVRGLSMLLELGDAVRILVAEQDGQLVGMGVLHYAVSTALGDKVATLEDVIVTKSARGRSIGKQLMAAIIERARADGAQRITLLTDHDNVAAQRFYASFGFERSSMVPLRRKLAQTMRV
jgi:ribosomal protein S18 acetylase RimI-like enzyme